MTNQDEKLAVFTDEVLDGKRLSETLEMTPEEALVLKLRDLISPNAPIDPAFRQRVMRRMMEEFDQQRSNRHAHHNKRRVIPLHPRVMGIAAAVTVAVVGLVLLLNSQNTPSGDNMGGTTPLATPEAVLVMVVLGLLGAGGYWFWMRRR